MPALFDAAPAGVEEQGQSNKTDNIAEATYDFCSTQVNLTGEDADRVRGLGREMIAPEDLTDKGLEETPHITVKYGLHEKNVPALQKAFEGEGAIHAQLGKIIVFKANEKRNSDVVVVEVNSPDLHRLNKKVADAIPHTDTYPDYHPHMTIAYVKPGAGEKYAGSGALSSVALTFTEIQASDKDGNLTPVKLGLTERIITIGPNDKAKRDKHVPDIHAMLHKSYEKVGGVKGSGFESPESMKSSIPLVKAVRKGGKVVAAVAYKDKGGRKVVAGGTDGSEEGKRALSGLSKDDVKRSWTEQSGPMLSVTRRSADIKPHLIHPKVVQKMMPHEKITYPVPDNDPEVIRHPDLKDHFYQREIGGKMHTKIAFGRPGQPIKFTPLKKKEESVTEDIVTCTRCGRGGHTDDGRCIHCGKDLPQPHPKVHEGVSLKRMRHLRVRRGMVNYKGMINHLIRLKHYVAPKRLGEGAEINEISYNPLRKPQNPLRAPRNVRRALRNFIHAPRNPRKHRTNPQHRLRYRRPTIKFKRLNIYSKHSTVLGIR